MIRIELTKPKFFVGEQIVGTAAIEFTQDTTVKHISVTFFGIVKTNSNSTNENDVDSFFSERSKTLVNVPLTCWTPPNGLKEDVLHGQHVYNFNFATAEQNFPPSFSGKHGYIRYSIIVTVERNWRPNITTSRVFTLFPLVDVRFREPEPITASFNHQVGVLSSGCISITWTVSRGCFCPQETIPLSLRIANNSTKEITKLEVSLLQKTHYWCKYEETKEKFVDLCSRKIDYPVPENATRDYTIGLEVPVCPPVVGVSGVLITILYFIRVSVALKWSNDFYFDHEIDIGTTNGTQELEAPSPVPAFSSLIVPPLSAKQPTLTSEIPPPVYTQSSEIQNPPSPVPAVAHVLPESLSSAAITTSSFGITPPLPLQSNALDITPPDYSQLQQYFTIYPEITDELHIQLTKSTYFLGDPIIGRVFLNFPKTIISTGLHINFKGEACAYSLSAIGSALTGDTKRDPFSGKTKCLCNMTVNCWSPPSGSKEAPLPGNDQVFYFKFETSGLDLPASFEGELCSVTYTINAVVKRNWTTDIKANEGFKLLPIMNVRGSIPLTLTSAKKLGVISTGIFSLEWSSPRSKFCPGEIIHLHIKGDNRTSKTATSLTVKFTQHVMGHSLGAACARRNDLGIRRIKDSIPEMSEKEFHVDIPIHDTCPPTIFCEQIVEVTYWITVLVHFKWDDDIVSTQSITIGTIGGGSEEVPPSKQSNKETTLPLPPDSYPPPPLPLQHIPLEPSAPPLPPPEYPFDYPPNPYLFTPIPQHTFPQTNTTTSSSSGTNTDIGPESITTTTTSNTTTSASVHVKGVEFTLL